MVPEPQQPGIPHIPRRPGDDPEVSLFAESDIELIAPGKRLVVVGFSHRTADLTVRSQFAVASDDLPLLTRRFKELPGVDGCVLLTTCNRVEAYLEIRSEAEAEAAFVELLGGQDLDGRALLARSMFCKGEDDAARHLLRVASGLDSMVLGDAQILGQTKVAYKDACAIGTASPTLHKAFHYAFRCAKQVRTETALDGAQSVSGAGMSLLTRLLGGLRKRKFLLVGINEMTTIAGRRLAKARAAHILVCNRTFERGRELAAELVAEQVPWENLLSSVAEVDAIVTATGASDAIFSRAELAIATADRTIDNPLYIVDMAVPPDVERAPEGETQGGTEGQSGATVALGVAAEAVKSVEEGVGADAAGADSIDAAVEAPSTTFERAADAASADAMSAVPIFTLCEGRVRVIDLEAIGAYQAAAEARRCKAAAGGEAIASRHLIEFSHWLHHQQMGPKMARLREEIEAALDRELARIDSRIDDDQRSLLSAFGLTMIKRFLGAYRRVDDEI